MIEPIHKSITVRRAPHDAFRLFTAEMGSWWPLESGTHVLADLEAGEKTERLVFEEHEGGRVYEVLSTGVEADWGVVITWDPPGRVVLDWNPSFEQRPHTEVEVTFTATDDGRTAGRPRASSLGAARRRRRPGDARRLRAGLGVRVQRTVRERSRMIPIEP